MSGYEGYYNYYNQGAYKTATASAVVNGLKYAAKTDAATLRPWNTRMKSVIGGAIYIGSRYINRGQNTIYYEKFDMVTPYTHQYMTNVLALEVSLRPLHRHTAIRLRKIRHWCLRFRFIKICRTVRASFRQGRAVQTMP